VFCRSDKKNIKKNDGKSRACSFYTKQTFMKKSTNQLQLNIEELEARIAPSVCPGQLGYEGQPGNQGNGGNNGGNGNNGYEGQPGNQCNGN
jgi:hypothetical protein